MSALKFTRNGDYTNDEANNVSGRSTVLTATVDSEMDEVLLVTDDHADKLDLLLRADLKMQDNILQGHEFSATAMAVLNGLLNQTTYLNYRQDWSTATAYLVGDLITETGNVYFCLVAHTSGTFATDLAASKWHLFVPASALGLPTATTNYLLSWNGAAYTWVPVTTTQAPTLAPLANPTFTGTVTLPQVNITDRMNFSVEAVTFTAGGNTFDFDTQFMKTVDVTGNYTGANTTVNIVQGDVMEVHFDNTSGADAALLWDASWVWMGYAPSLLPLGKKAVLSLRAPTGATAADIIALWSVEP